MANLQTNVPLVNDAFVDPATGKITESWFIFLIQLWRRTGGGGGSEPSTLTIDDVFAIEETFGYAAPASVTDFLSQLTTVATPSVQAPLTEMTFAQPSFSASTSDFGAAMTAWFNSLPTSLPASPGVLWNNGGTLSQS